MADQPPTTPYTSRYLESRIIALEISVAELESRLKDANIRIASLESQDATVAAHLPVDFPTEKS